VGCESVGLERLARLLVRGAASVASLMPEREAEHASAQLALVLGPLAREVSERGGRLADRRRLLRRAVGEGVDERADLGADRREGSEIVLAFAAAAAAAVGRTDR
jgi:hypothetical protein